MNAVFRFIVTMIICILPTVLFYGLWYGLHYLRDDELIQQLQQREDIDLSAYDPQMPGTDRDVSLPGQSPSGESTLPTQSSGRASTLPTQSPTKKDTQSASGQTCPDCGVDNREGVDYCRQCLSELPSN